MIDFRSLAAFTRTLTDTASYAAGYIVGRLLVRSGVIELIDNALYTEPDDEPITSASPIYDQLLLETWAADVHTNADTELAAWNHGWRPAAGIGGDAA